ncbi:malto-oligosyltrehalose synthase [Cryobacterium levicorallinum]|uniref:(1->4)-alpha-D-glucan 1-alpha-D-glucosylmutase n=1 Tax=Cryobacterium levicorallinum TaxID=995038 RepID=A0A1I3BX67_9MICO|nr:malto-oligosyltrehalose synthase [Cryobacterium levicorallinum]TFB85639.1 malto-oligosyltrehalose synthase [Cryobacterium levicorallinum]GEP27219.1 malto-oligosyltrehalose synthase [Cryobacterium levicorallinum]SFH66905.1 (1->4)-alpha-D-glucan 1-alpha-D-glucosylmutase [Cryobacterium levicorallinum]
MPLSTYRLQITAGFDLDAAAEIVDYVRSLGAGWVYLSPLLKAEPGSDHGYDVVDHSLVDPARGGAAGLVRLATAAHQAGCGVLVDIVPNHMGVASPAQNAWWWDLLQNGQQSRYAEAFDVDWAFGNGKIRIPVLGDDGSDGRTELDRLKIVGGELHYFDNRFPLAAESNNDGASPADVHSRQHYELVNWRRADAELNYRRFFAVNSLAGIRVEVPWVFEESHREIVRWVRDGLVQGLRVDHPDGLADPAGYLEALRRATDGCYVLVEKILEGREALPTSWATAGTTGYDALADVDRVLVDPAGQEPLDALEASLQGVATDWADLVYRNKRDVTDGILRSEVLRIARLVPSDTGNLAPTAEALADLLAWFPVYRSYLPVGSENLREAARRSATRRPELQSEIDRLLPLLGDPGHPAAVRFQQTSGMVMAKGVEDRAYYRFSRLTSLNEVGADPDEFAVPVAEFHKRQRTRQAGFPHSMTTLSTHDTKRGEDVRARIAVLAEIPAEWAEALHQLRAAHPLDDAPFENLLWQAIVGAWPASRERLAAYALKAAREAGTSTTWTQPNTGFEAALDDLVTAAVESGPTRDLLTALVDRLQQPGWSNSLSQKLLQLTMPGVPDVYQGSELWETSLVDPDNRRPVDYALRRELLTRLESGWLPPVDETGAAKLLVTSSALHLRGDRSDLFTRYLPVPAFGPAAGHIVAFDRGGAITVATRLPIGLHEAGGWRDTTIAVAGRTIVDVFTRQRFDGPSLRVADVLARYPVALLVAADDRDRPSHRIGRHT